jgi:hypothetical protein
MPSQQGLTYVQSAQLEVRPNPVDHAANQAIIDLFASSIDSDVLWDLERLVNETAPEALT